LHPRRFGQRCHAQFLVEDAHQASVLLESRVAIVVQRMQTHDLHVRGFVERVELDPTGCDGESLAIPCPVAERGGEPLQRERQVLAQGLFAQVTPLIERGRIAQLETLHERSRVEAHGALQRPDASVTEPRRVLVMATDACDQLGELVHICADPGDQFDHVAIGTQAFVVQLLAQARQRAPERAPAVRQVALGPQEGGEPVARVRSGFER
jgi:hypothetical protein